MVKSRMVQARVDPEIYDMITRAAALTHESVSGFVVRAACTEAGRVLARAGVTWMSAEQFDTIIGSLDDADPAPTLARVAGRRRPGGHA